MRQTKSAVCSLVVLALFLPFSTGLGGGWNLAGVGAKALSMSGAFRAIADDHSAMYWNPAGLAGQSTSLYLEAKTLFPMTWVTPNTPSTTPGFDGYYLYRNGMKRTSKATIYPAGSFSFLYQVDNKITTGLSVFSPSALGNEWDRLTLGPYQGYNENPSYPSKDWSTDFKVMDIHPTVGYRVDEKLRIGLGISIDYANVVLQAPKVTPSDDGTGNPIPMPAHHFFIDTELNGDGIGYGFNIGILYEVNEKLRVGASYHSPVTIGLKGSVKQTLYMPNITEEENRKAEPDAEADLPLPMDFGVGAAYEPIEYMTVAADIVWTNWKTVDEIDIDMDGVGLDGQAAQDSKLILHYEDTIRLSLGVNYILDPKKGLELRGGYYYDPTPIPGETLRPNITDAANKSNFSLGCALNLSEKVMLEGYWEHLFSGKRTVSAKDNDGDGLYDNVPGEWKTQVDTFGFSLRYLFK